MLLAVLTAVPQRGRANPIEVNVPVEDILAILRTNLTDASTVEMNTAAVLGLLGRYKGRVDLVDPAKEKKSLIPLLGKSQLFNDDFAYLRIQRVDKGLADSLQKELKRLKPDGKIGGWLVDLRYATGMNYEAALELADRFISAERIQMMLGKQALSSSAKTNAFSGPVTILVNHQTSGAAEILAALLRRNNVGLVIGNATAGEARIFSEFEISGDLRLRVSTDTVRMPDGQPFSDKGVKPDIAVKVGSGDEKIYYRDAFSLIPLNRLQSSRVGGNQRITEADLVRQLRLKLDPDATIAAAPLLAKHPIVRDPVLARALDLLRGLKIVGPLK